MSCDPVQRRRSSPPGPSTPAPAGQAGLRALVEQSIGHLTTVSPPEEASRTPALLGRLGGLEAGAELFDALVVAAHAVAGPVERGHGAVVEEPVEDRGDNAQIELQ